MSKGFYASLNYEQKALVRLTRSMNAMLKRAVRPVGKALVKRVRQNCPVKDGYLKKSIGQKQIAKGGKSASVIVGPRRAWQRTKAKADGTNETIRPAKYARAVENRVHFLAKSMSNEDINMMKDEMRKAISEALKP